MNETPLIDFGGVFAAFIEIVDSVQNQKSMAPIVIEKYDAVWYSIYIVIRCK